jgi:DNA-3-methyladenine glycosylase II
LILTAWALRRRERNIVDLWDATTYQRVLEIGGFSLKVAVRQVGSREHSRLHVSVTGRQISRDAQNRVASALVRILGLRMDLTDFYALAARDRRLAPLVERFLGVKPPRFPTVFEGLVNAIACQKLPLTVGIELLNRLAIQCSPAIRTDGATRFAFPRPEDLVRLTPQKFRQLGFSYSKASSLLDLSRSLVERKTDLEELGAVLGAVDDAQAIETLMTDYAALVLSLPSLAVDAFGSTISSVLPFRVAVALDGSTSADRSCTRKICCERTSE